MPNVDIPNVGVVEFPDDMPPDSVSAAAHRLYVNANPATTAPAEPADPHAALKTALYGGAAVAGAAGAVKGVKALGRTGIAGRVGSEMLTDRGPVGAASRIAFGGNKPATGLHTLTAEDVAGLPAFKDAKPGEVVRRVRYEIERYGKPGSAAATAASAPGASAPGAPAGLPLNAEPQVPTREMLGMSKSGDLAQQVRLQKWRQFVQGRRSDILTRELEDAGKSTVGVPRARLAASAEGNVAGEIVPAVKLGQKATPTQRGASGRVLAQRAKGLAALPEGESDLARQMQKSLALEKLMTERGIPQAERAGLRAGVAMAERGALGPALRGVASLGGPAVELLLAILNSRDLPAQMAEADRTYDAIPAVARARAPLKKALARAPQSL
jgi:hypothetical protein